MSELELEPGPLDRPLSRKETRRALGPIPVGVGAILLAAVDDWNVLSERHGARMRTQMQELGRGSYVAATTASGTEVWLNSRGLHPPGHLVAKAYRWPAISSHGKTYLAIHHNEVQPTNDRRKAFRRQDSSALGLMGDPTHCELTWEFDRLTDRHIQRIWVSAPAVDWDRIEVPMARVQAQLAAWRKRAMTWLPGTVSSGAPEVTPLTTRDDGDRLKPDITVEPPQRSDEDAGGAG